MPNTVWRDSLSRSILDLVEDKASIGSWSWDLTTGAMNWSIGVYRIFGLAPSDLPDLSNLAALIEGSEGSVLGHPNSIFVAKFLADRKFSIRREDGELRTVHSHGKLVTPAGGGASFVGAFLDITESPLEDELFLLREALLESMRNLFGVAIWQIDADGSEADLMQWSVAASNDSVGASPWSRLELVHPDDVASLELAWHTARKNKHTFSARFRMKRNDEFVPSQSHAVSLLNGSGEVRGWIGYTGIDKSGAEPSVKLSLLSSSQVRAARGLLNWTCRELAAKAEVSFSTVRRLETSGPTGLSASSLSAIENALREAGISFVQTADGGLGIIVAPKIGLMTI